MNGRVGVILGRLPASGKFFLKAAAVRQGCLELSASCHLLVSLVVVVVVVLVMLVVVVFWPWWWWVVGGREATL